MSRGPGTATRVLGAALSVALVTAAGAGAQTPPPLTTPKVGDFRSVLAQGEGQSATASDLAANQATGEVPDRFVDQQPLYVDIMPRASTLTDADLDVFYKPTDFGSMPGGVESVTSPRGGVQIFRDKRFGMAHVYGTTRDDVMFGAGYATAEERLFLMDAIRHTAKGTLAGLTGASAASDDAAQLTDQDFSDAELTAQFNALPERFGAEGARARQDILSYIEGINKRIDEVNSNPSELPAEYPALGTRPERWTPADTAAMAVLLVTQFTVSNGGEERNALMQLAFQKRFGRRWRAPYSDLRTAEDPEAFTVAKERFPSDRPGKVRRGLNAIPERGSLKRRNAIVSGPGAAASAADQQRQPDWVTSVEGLKRSLPHHASNAVVVAGSKSKTGRPLAAMGPQVSYYSPQIFAEYELHGGGVDSQGVTFPGASPYPLIGHGTDFVWSGTSANGDNQDTFAERLCNPDGSAPTEKSTHYLYKGKCTPFTSRDQKVTTPVSPVDPQPPQTITYRTLRSVHGPVFAYARVAGKPVALAKAKGVNFHELDAVIPFMRLAENRPTDAKSFMQMMGDFPGTENWFYADDRDAAFIQSGRYPRHTRGSDVDTPFWGDGTADWQDFDPVAYTFATIPPANRPRALNAKRDGFSISWNNKEAPGWRKGPTEWSNGPVHHAMILDRRLRAEMKRNGGKVDLAGLTRTVNLAATTDLRAPEDYPWMRRVIGRTPGPSGALALLDAWQRSGGKRLDENGDNVYEHSAAIAVMDAWWPRAVKAQFEPGLGPDLFKELEDGMLGLDDFGWDWASHVQKDLRAVLGRRVRGRYSRIWCGGGSDIRGTVPRGAALRKVRSRCRALLLSSLREAIGEVEKKQGPDPAKWKVPATCERPVRCDQIEPTTAGAIPTPPFPWQNRGTFHQITEVKGHR